MTILLRRRDGLLAALVASACILGVVATGCALTSKAAVVNIRYFSPEHASPGAAAADGSARTPAAAPNGAIDLRLGRVSSGSNLRERIAYRDDAYELGYYEDLRWTERPETFVRREIGRTLFEEHGLHRVFGGLAPTLDIEVISFDDLRLPSGRAARVQLKAMLSDDSGVLWEDTLTVDRPVQVAKPKIEDVVAAMASALDGVAEQVALKVQTVLASRPAHPPPP